MNKQKKIVIFLVGFFILLTAVFMGYYYSITQVKEVALPYLGEKEHKVRPFSFTNQEMQTITQEDVKEKIYVAEYFFATCKGICPQMNENLNIVYQHFKGNSQVLFLSHTVDPLEDSAAALKAYSLQFDAKPDQWMFLTGDKKALYDHARYSYLISAQDDTAGVSIDQDFIHDNHFVLVDRKGYIRGMYDGLVTAEMTRLIQDIELLLQAKVD
jgi:protein SCO1/2